MKHEFYLHRICVVAGRLKPYQRYSISLLLMVCVSIVWFIGMYQPLNRSMHFYENELVHLNKKVRHSKIAQLQYVENKNNLLETQELFAVSRAANKRVTPRDYMALVFECAKNTGFFIDSYAAKTLQDKQWYTNHIISLQAHGSTASFLAFCQALTKTQKTIRLHNFSVTMHENGHAQLHADIHHMQLK